MGTGYTRNDTGNNIADGNVINASDLDGEFDAVESAFNGSTGHSHDGTTGEGPQIDTAGIANDAVDSDKLDETDSYTVAGLSVTGNTTLGDAATDTVTFTADVASNILPNADGTLSLGASGSSWGDAYVTTLYVGGTEVTSTAAELNVLDGVTSTTAELNILDGVTSTSSELNLVDGSTAGTVVNSKAVIYGASGEVNATTLQVGGSSITATPAELNTLDGITSTTAELNILDGVTSTSSELNLVDGSVAGTVVNNKAVVYGAAGEVNATKLQVGGTDITATPAEINVLDGITATTTELNHVDGVTSNIQTQINNIDTDLVNDTTPQLGGDLDLNSNDITGTGDINITGSITATSFVGIDTDKIEEGNSSVEVVDTGTGHVAVTVDGSETARFDASGRLGIGTTNPSTELHLLSSSPAISFTDGVSTATISGDGAHLTYDTVSSGRDHRFRAGGTDIAEFNGNGNFSFNSGYGSVATAYGCRAWVNFDAAATPAIRADGNVSSITDNGTGNFTVNFTTAIVDDDYSVTAMAQRNDFDNSNILIACVGNTASDWSTTSVSLGVTVNVSGAQNANDPRTAAIAVFR